MRMTFSLPDKLAERFLAIVPDRERSMTIAKLLEKELASRDGEILRACLEANKDEALNAEIDEWLALEDDFEEPVS